MNMSFNDYINRLRIAEAKKLVQKGDIKIQGLIEKVGYSNSEYFYKLFKKYEGIYYQDYKQKYESI
jgi:two-component system response regulator YesN